MSENKGRNSSQKRKSKRLLFGSRSYVHCCFCKRQIEFDRATIEHILPLSLGGNWTLKNLQLSCSDCNSERGNADFYLYRDWRRGLGEKPPMQVETKQSLDDLLNDLAVQYRKDRLSELS